MRRTWWILSAGLLAACGWSPETRYASAFTNKQLGARYYSDLGPDVIDVSSYPRAQRMKYRTFLKHCRTCHTAARAINAPVIRPDDWRRYIRRMHERGEARGWLDSVPLESYGDLVDFLVYDSHVRKVLRKDEFARQTAELKSLFNKVKAERRRLGLEADRTSARQGAADASEKLRH